MANKLLVGVVVIVVIAALAVFFNWPTLRPALPNVEDVGDASCNLPQSSCNNTVLTFYRCSNGSAVENDYDCTRLNDAFNNWNCNPRQITVKNGVETIRANCDIAPRLLTVPNASTSPTANGQQGAAQSDQEVNASPPQRAPPLAYCGNDYIDADETCNSCAEDFKCSASEFCEEESGLCRKINSFGDDRCTQQENTTGSDCSACGCADSQICNEFSHRCQAAVVVNAAFEAKVDAVVNATISDSNSTAYIGLVDTIYANQSAKMAVFDCDTTNTFFCRTFVILDRNGNVLETVHST